MAKRAAVPVRKPIVKQVTDDIVEGGKQLIDQGKAAVGKVKEGFRKTKKFLGG